MARVTVEDCLENIENRFALIIVAAKRTKKIVQGAKPLIQNRGDKPHVIALREIAAGQVNIQQKPDQ